MTLCVIVFPKTHELHVNILYFYIYIITVKVFCTVEVFLLLQSNNLIS